MPKKCDVLDYHQEAISALDVVLDAVSVNEKYEVLFLYDQHGQIDKAMLVDPIKERIAFYDKETDKYFYSNYTVTLSFMGVLIQFTNFVENLFGFVSKLLGTCPAVRHHFLDEIIEADKVFAFKLICSYKLPLKVVTVSIEDGTLIEV